MNARWIPHLLTDEQKRSCVLNAKYLSRMFPKYSKKSFNNFLTGDETQVYYFKANRKCSNRVWATKNVAKRLRTVKKVLFVKFSFSH